MKMKNLLSGPLLAGFLLVTGQLNAQLETQAQPKQKGQPKPQMQLKPQGQVKTQEELKPQPQSKLSSPAAEKTVFQTGSPWIPEIDVRSDAAIVYGAGDRKGLSFGDRVKSWRDKGYTTQFMTGIAWGQYPDYFLGNWDGKNHLGVGQVTMQGDTIWHGKNMPYIVPVASFIEYMKSAVIKKVIDAGIKSIYLEEPEFWARAGYSEVFKQEWQRYYGSPWQPQDQSPANTYLSNKLKYHLYYDAIREVSSFAKSYGRSRGMDVKIYIATHSLVNYSSWEIVSPEASLASLPGIDGYIAQVWTGTSRTPVYFNGEKKEQVFENAYLEYGSMVSMTAPTGRRMYFLTDPIEDWPRDWADYKRNYEATYTAEILYPMVDNYEVMPWPERIYTHPYKLSGNDEPVLIPRYYSTQMQIMINCLNKMPLSDNEVSGSHGIGVLMSNSLMFQRYPIHHGYDDPQFSNFYGQTLPLLKSGIPVSTVHIENLPYAATLKDLKVLVMSYSNMKPMTPDAHQQIVNWVRKGGILIYCGKDDDPYQSVPEWWNMSGNTFHAAADHLFGLMSLSSPSGDTVAPVGKGTVYVIRTDPKNFVLQEGGSEAFMKILQKAYEIDAKAGVLQVKNNFCLERGPYRIISVMRESVNNDPYRVKGHFIDLFDPTLPAIDEKTVEPGQQALLYDLNRIPDRRQPSILAAAARIYEEQVKGRHFDFIAKGPAKTTNNMRMNLPGAPKTVKVMDYAGNVMVSDGYVWDAASGTCFLSFENEPKGVKVEVAW